MSKDSNDTKGAPNGQLQHEANETSGAPLLEEEQKQDGHGREVPQLTDNTASLREPNDNNDTTSVVMTSPQQLDEILVNYDALQAFCDDNIAFFANDQSSKGQRLHGAFVGLIDHIESSKSKVVEMAGYAHEYDFDENTPGNGYRSFLVVVNAMLLHCMKLCKSLAQSRKSLLFRKGWFMREIESCNHLLASISTCLNYLSKLRSWCHDGELFPKENRSAVELFETGETVNQYCFYGRCLGFQFCDSMKGVLRFIAICMAGFSESYYSQAGLIAKTTSSVWTSGKYFWNPELRARRIVNISQNSSVDFCKAFWFLAESELMHTIPSVVGSPVKINKVISIPPEPLQMPNRTTGELVDIPIPSSHLGPGSVSARLLSSKIRRGMMGEVMNGKSLAEPSKGLIIHCHGGGFVAQSSKSHELYLRDWAVALDTPILSIDYSLAPRAPFPRAHEEVFYAYCWALKNCAILGSLGERIILAGDSAGANLNVGVSMKCIEHDIRRPDGLFLAYCPVLVSFTPSPARLLCLMDPLLPFGFMMRCLKAYASPSPEIIEENKKNVKHMEDIRNASNDFEIFSLDQSPFYSRSDKPTSSISSAENSNWEHLDVEEKTIKSVSDEISDTFASASYHSQTVENTELLTPDEGSCISFEEDSQPIGCAAVEKPETPRKSIESEKYVSEFMEKYVLEAAEEAVEDDISGGRRRKLSCSTAKTPSEDNIIVEAGKDVMTVRHLQRRINRVAEDLVTAVSSTLNKFTMSSEIKQTASPTEEQKNFDALIARSPSDEFIFQVPKDPLLSPYFASDEILKQLPVTKILTIEMDPCLDDCVMFAKKLKKLGTPVSLDILKGLPHGFLNFSMLSKEAYEGSQVCIRRISEILN